MRYVKLRGCYIYYTVSFVVFPDLIITNLNEIICFTIFCYGSLNILIIVLFPGRNRCKLFVFCKTTKLKFHLCNPQE